MVWKSAGGGWEREDTCEVRTGGNTEGTMIKKRAVGKEGLGEPRKLRMCGEVMQKPATLYNNLKTFLEKFEQRGTYGWIMPISVVTTKFLQIPQHS